ncbi:MAG TPA: TIGR01777 family oxidoreductase [Vicinamibacterales bacterium]|nr:TIGR01777 family oxidoreductase [Vicinamibacterales bacterium]
MRLVIAGGTGFLGSSLAQAYADEGHDVRVLSRSLPAGQSAHESGTGMPGVTRVGWSPAEAGGGLADLLSGADAVVNLAGESIGGKRWTPARRQALRDSRLTATRRLASAIQAAAVPPPVFVSASGVGFYGPHGNEALTEPAPAGRDFLARLCAEWEEAALLVRRPGVRVAVVRTGMVLERSGGALEKMIPVFRAFAGGPFGSGRQFVSWIHRLDWIEMVRWIVQSPEVSGPVNATAPYPVVNRVFAHALGRALRRPALIPAPGFALRAVLGEMADSLLTGQRVIPARALQGGFHFRYPEIDLAFRGIFGE